MEQRENKNIPYVKQFDENNEVVNKITKDKALVNIYPNRKQRREHLNQPRHRGNNKGNALTVIGKWKYKKVQQLIDTKTGVNVINHSLPVE